MDGEPHDIFRRAKEMKSLGLDIPQVAALSHYLIELGLPLKGISITVNEFLQDSFINNLVMKKEEK
jgi:hypothetical protein